VRIFPRAVDHEREAALERAWVRPTHFSGKRVLIGQVKEWKKDLTLNRPFLEGTHQSLSSPPHLTIIECNIWNKEAKTFTSKSCASLAKLMFYWLEPPKISKLFATEASFATAIPNKVGKATLRVISPTHRSCQKLILVPSPLRIWCSLKKSPNLF
jgi:hypothetical protein